MIKHQFQDEIEILYRTKTSFNASSEDNDAVEELYSSLEIEGPDTHGISANTSEPKLKFNSDADVRAFELTAKNKSALLAAMDKHDVQLRFCCVWNERLETYFSQCLSGIPESKVCCISRCMYMIG